MSTMPDESMITLSSGKKVSAVNPTLKRLLKRRSAKSDISERLKDCTWRVLLLGQSKLSIDEIIVKPIIDDLLTAVIPNNEDHWNAFSQLAAKVASPRESCRRALTFGKSFAQFRQRHSVESDDDESSQDVPMIIPRAKRPAQLGDPNNNRSDFAAAFMSKFRFEGVGGRSEEYVEKLEETKATAVRLLEKTGKLTENMIGSIVIDLVDSAVTRGALRKQQMTSSILSSLVTDAVDRSEVERKETDEAEQIEWERDSTSSSSHHRNVDRILREYNVDLDLCSESSESDETNEDLTKSEIISRYFLSMEDCSTSSDDMDQEGQGKIQTVTCATQTDDELPAKAMSTQTDSPKGLLIRPIPLTLKKFSELTEFFTKFGPITSLEILEKRQYFSVFVVFETEEALGKAASCQGPWFGKDYLEDIITATITSKNEMATFVNENVSGFFSFFAKLTEVHEFCDDLTEPCRKGNCDYPDNHWRDDNSTCPLDYLGYEEELQTLQAELANEFKECFDALQSNKNSVFKEIVTVANLFLMSEDVPALDEIPLEAEFKTDMRQKVRRAIQTEAILQSYEKTIDLEAFKFVFEELEEDVQPLMKIPENWDLLLAGKSVDEPLELIEARHTFLITKGQLQHAFMLAKASGSSDLIFDTIDKLHGEDSSEYAKIAIDVIQHLIATDVRMNLKVFEVFSNLLLSNFKKEEPNDGGELINLLLVCFRKAPDLFIDLVVLYVGNLFDGQSVIRILKEEVYAFLENGFIFMGEESDKYKKMLHMIASTLLVRFPGLKEALVGLAIKLFKLDSMNYIEAYLSIFGDDEYAMDAIVDVVEAKTAFGSTWFRKARTVIFKIGEKVKEAFPSFSRRIMKVVLEQFAIEPEHYAHSVFTFGTDEDIAAACNSMTNYIKDKRVEGNLSVVRLFLQHNRPKDFPGLETMVSLYFERATLTARNFDDLMNYDFWKGKTSCFRSCLNERWLQVVSKDESEWLQTCETLARTCRSDRSLAEIAKSFMKNLRTKVAENIREASQPVPVNWARDAKMIEQCQHGANWQGGLNRTGCEGCQLLVKFLANPTWTEKNITVNEAGRRCVMKCLEKWIKDRDGRRVQVSHKLNVTYRLLSYNENMERFSSKRCGAVLVTKMPDTNSNRDNECRKLKDIERQIEALIGEVRRSLLDMNAPAQVAGVQPPPPDPQVAKPRASFQQDHQYSQPNANYPPVISIPDSPVLKQSQQGQGHIRPGPSTTATSSTSTNFVPGPTRLAITPSGQRVVRITERPGEAAQRNPHHGRVDLNSNGKRPGTSIANAAPPRAQMRRLYNEPLSPLQPPSSP